MKAKTANSRRLDILGNGDRSSDQQILTATLKQWRQKLGYCSIFAAVPAILASHISEARSDEAKKPEASVAGRTTRLLERLNMSFSKPELLKRQSKFRLPHQKGSFDLLAPLAGNDGCPGSTIPEGNYTAAAPYIDSGDTTGANDTVTSLFSYYYYYYSYDAHGPDHVYSFTLSGRGPNPQIEVSTTSGTYTPLTYVLHGGFAGACPAGTGNNSSNWLVLSESPSIGGTATLNSGQMNNLPLSVPLHLFVDSTLSGPNSAGPYTIRIQDVTIAPPCPNPNPIDCPDVFVRQQYLDFLNREPDAGGLAYWTNQITQCGSDAVCAHNRRIDVSAAFFISLEFQQTGSFVYGLYKGALGRQPHYAEFTADHNRVIGGTNLDAEKAALANDFVQRPEFLQHYPGSLANKQFVNRLFDTAGLFPFTAERQAEINAMNQGRTRAQVLRNVIDIQAFKDREFNPSFVLMQYFGYLRRDIDQGGYAFWLDILNATGNFRGMVCSFITSSEYQLRFGPVTRSNADCN